MNGGKFKLLVAFALVTGAAQAEKERVIRFQNHVRIGYDDNIYNTDEAVDTGFVTEIVNLSAKLNFSSRSDLLLYWQPHFEYRFDADQDTAVYQDLYGRFSHAISQRAFLTLSDRFRYQQKDGQTGGASDAPSFRDQNYMENDLMGALDYTLNTISYLTLGAGYEFRVWDDEEYGQDLGNDYDQFKLNGSYVRQFNPEKTDGMFGVNYNDLSYDGDRGGYESVVLFGGIDQTFSPTVTGFGRVGVSMNDVETRGVENDTTTPYFDAGLEVKPSDRTSLNGSVGYSVYRSENSLYNAQDRFNIGLGVRHDITAKINLSSSLSYVFSQYSSDYSDVGVDDVDDTYISWAIRAAYQINRNNFLEAGYLFRTRSSDSFSEYDGNRVDIGWRLRI